MKLSLLFFFIVVYLNGLAQSYDQAIVVLQASKMTPTSKGSVSQNYWVQDVNGGVFKSVVFPKPANYRFDFTGRGSKYGRVGRETWTVLSIKVDDVTKATITIGDKLPNIWTTIINVPAGSHKVSMIFTNDNGSSSFKLYMALLYITPVNLASSNVPVKYLAVTSDTLPDFGTKFLNRNHFASKQLRGMAVNRLGQTIIDGFSQYNMNLLRLFIEIKNYNKYDYQIVPGELDSADRILKIAKQQGFYVNIVVTEDTQDETFWGVPSLQNDYVNIIGQIALRYKDSVQVACISLCNEPAMVGHLGEWCFLAQRLANAVRSNDPNHVIVMPFGTGIQDMWRLTEPLPFDNVVYEYHCYIPYKISHQGIEDSDNVRTEYPNYKGSPYYNESYLGEYNKDSLSLGLQLLRDFSVKWNCPIYIGEFSCTNWSPVGTSCAYIRDCIDLFEKESWAWTYLSYRRYMCYDAEIPPNVYLKYPYINAQPQVPDINTLAQYRTDTTCAMKIMLPYFKLNKVTSVRPGARSLHRPDWLMPLMTVIALMTGIIVLTYYFSKKPVKDGKI